MAFSSQSLPTRLIILLPHRPLTVSLGPWRNARSSSGMASRDAPRRSPIRGIEGHNLWLYALSNPQSLIGPGYTSDFLEGLNREFEKPKRGVSPLPSVLADVQR